MTLPATLPSLGEACRIWDVLVVGAGPAGAVAAHELARRGARVLLADRVDFPRGKVCGGCLSVRGLGVLNQLGLGDLPKRLGAVPLTHARLCRPALHAGARARARAFVSEAKAVGGRGILHLQTPHPS